MSIYRYTLDDQMFFLINGLPHTPLTNFIGLALSGAGTAGIIWFLIGVYLFYREEKKDHWFFAPIVAAGILSGILVNLILKPFIHRLRPMAESGAYIIGSRSTDYSFPSGHAAIAFAMAVVLSYKEPKMRRIFYVLAIAISLSRIFLGMHYPLDVLAGGILGWVIGIASLRILAIIKK